MCPGVCGAGGTHGNPSARSSSGSRYALCALGVGLVALGVVMIIWTVVPLDAAANQNATFLKPRPTDQPGEEEEEESKSKTSSVAFVLVGAGAAILLLAICLGVREKKRSRHRASQPTSAGAQPQFRDQGDQESAEPPPDYGVPSYEDAVGSGQYPIRQSNLRNSTTHLPSYEDLIAAVNNEPDAPGPSAGTTHPPPDTDPPPAADDHAPTDPAPSPAPSPAPAVPPQRSASRASRLLRPLRVRRFRSEKLHLKEVRLNINPPAPGTVVLEPLTPPPQYDGDKAPPF
ncbi:transmembrane protein 51b [Sardina pilchardus]|uniref:transmembrane protein 51b n=1 Tax=Sardina pilchardus TaxID=27697 RepID=UPI002E0ED246